MLIAIGASGFDPVGHRFFLHLSELAWIYKVFSIPHSSHCFFTEPFLAEVLNSSNYDETKLSWEMKSIHDDFSFQFVLVDDSS
jgi:hypothetical protein